MRGQRLHVLNCNQHTETSDFLGGFRPARGRDRALASFGGQAAQVLAHPLVAESGAQVPIVSDSPSVTEVPIVAAQLQATAVHAAKWVQLQQQQQQEQQQQQQGQGSAGADAGEGDAGKKKGKKDGKKRGAAAMEQSSGAQNEKAEANGSAHADGDGDVDEGGKKAKKAKKEAKKAKKGEQAELAPSPATPGGQAEAQQQGPGSSPEQDQQGEQRQEGGSDSDKKKGNSTFKAFQRVKAEEWLGKKGAWDNSYEGTFGQDGWGFKAQQALGAVRGKDFRHEKTKKKRGTYRGGVIDGSSHSYKFDSDDE
mmetsp:Transcript_23350/g.60816  ORF Transcript_23350/g.60816 Transcript_23350/m.60816 type:complete len:309 (+) Transcript_23350:2-928(+)